MIHVSIFLFLSRQVQLISLCPEGMPALSGSNNNGNCGKQYKQEAANVRPASNNLLAPSTKQAEANIEKSVSSMVETSQKLEQDDMEGVDEKEWGKIFNHEQKHYHGSRNWNPSFLLYGNVP